MKKFLISMAAVAALTAVAAPAAAQSYDRGDRYESRHDRRGGLDRADRMQSRIERAYQRGAVSRQEAARLKGYVRAVENLADRYRRDGAYTRWERDQIARRYASVESRLYDDRRDYGSGYGHRR